MRDLRFSRRWIFKSWSSFCDTVYGWVRLPTFRRPTVPTWNRRWTCFRLLNVENFHKYDNPEAILLAPNSGSSQLSDALREEGLFILWQKDICTGLPSAKPGTYIRIRFENFMKPLSVGWGVSICLCAFFALPLMSLAHRLFSISS
jgi:hypothetical protein